MRLSLDTLEVLADLGDDSANACLGMLDELVGTGAVDPDDIAAETWSGTILTSEISPDIIWLGAGFRLSLV